MKMIMIKRVMIIIMMIKTVMLRVINGYDDGKEEDEDN